MRWVTRLVKYRVLGCRRQVLQRGLWQKEPQVGPGNKVSCNKELTEVMLLAEVDEDFVLLVSSPWLTGPITLFVDPSPIMLLSLLSLRYSFGLFLLVVEYHWSHHTFFLALHLQNPFLTCTVSASQYQLIFHLSSQISMNQYKHSTFVAHLTILFLNTVATPALTPPISCNSWYYFAFSRPPHFTQTYHITSIHTSISNGRFSNFPICNVLTFCIQRLKLISLLVVPLEAVLTLRSKCGTCLLPEYFTLERIIILSPARKK